MWCAVRPCSLRKWPRCWHQSPGSPSTRSDAPWWARPMTDNTKRHRAVVRLRPRASAILAVTSLVGVAAFGWPFLIHSHSNANQAHAGDAPWLFVVLLPLLLAVV